MSSLAAENLIAPKPLASTFSSASLRDGDLALVVAIALQALEFSFAYPATIMKMLLVVVCTAVGKVAFLPAILVCQLYASDFQLQEMQSYEYLLERYETSRVYVLGFPLTTNYVFALALTFKVLASVANSPATFRGIISPATVFLWAACFPVAILAALTSLTQGAHSWTAPIRDVMMVGCYFLGIIMGEDREAARRVITTRIVPGSLAMLTLALFGFFYCRGMYWVTAAGPAVLLVALSRRKVGVSLPAAIAWAVLASAYAFAIYPTAFAKQVAIALYSEAATTFALKGMWVGGIAAVVIAALTRGRLLDHARWMAGRLVRSRLAWIAAGVMVTFPIALAAASYSVTVEMSSKKFTVELPWQERFLFKMLYDRAPIYRGAIDEVCSPPYFFKAGERASYRLMLNGDKIFWPAGSHNLVLEELRRNGWYSGIVCLWIIVSAMMMAATAMSRTSDPMLVWYAAASFVTILVSGLTSHIPMETNAAIWMLTPAGIAAAMYRGEARLPR